MAWWLMPAAGISSPTTNTRISWSTASGEPASDRKDLPDPCCAAQKRRQGAQEQQQQHNAHAWGADFAELRREAHDAATTLSRHRISFRPNTIDAQ